jgi:GNAT superfamily N-acetyltransferase
VWRGYHGIVDPAVLAGLDPVQAAARWRGLLSGPTPPEVVVALRRHPSGAERIGAFCTVGPTRDPAADGPSGELWALYADPDVYGTGAGFAAHRAGLDLLRRAGHREAVVWVLAANRRGRAFYARQGWRGDELFEHREVRGVPMLEVRYSRSLAGPDPAVPEPRAASTPRRLNR